MYVFLYLCIPRVWCMFVTVWLDGNIGFLGAGIISSCVHQMWELETELRSPKEQEVVLGF